MFKTFDVRRISSLLIVLAFGAGCAHQKPHNTTVVWISIDGLRGDYVGRAKPPTLISLAREGASTNQLRPIFPSLTFPNHIAQVTGTTVDGNGIPMNGFLDTATGQKYNFPDESSLIRAEPIWTTAKRQGLRVAVIDWPMSYQQTGEFKSDYFDERFDKKQTDAERLARVAEILKNDHGPKPLQLVITYVAELDTAGHKYGPDAPEVDRQLRETDKTVARFLQNVTAWFDESHAKRRDDELYVLITTDHGMAPVQTAVNLDRLIGGELLDGAQAITSGPCASVYLTNVPPEQRAERAAQIVAKLRGVDYVRAWRAADVPAAFHYTDPSRIGDVVVLLSPGYNFTSTREAVTRPASTQKGAHGYDPAVCPEMLGGAILWRYKHDMHGRGLGPVDNTQWHATVARLLGIDPSPKADPRAVIPPTASKNLPLHELGGPNMNAG